MSYYDDLSAGSSDDHGSLESDEETSDVDDQEWLVGRGRRSKSSSPELIRRYSTLETGLWNRTILHLDVDCFYCQCEEIDRGLRKEEVMPPLAIGQKHIIVTSNYEARRYGVQKLQLRDAAYKACPHLWIVEGSDLIEYRRHSRAIYEAFRAALQKIADELDEEAPFQIPSRKGCMDEMMADLTPAVERILSRPHKYQSHCQACDPDQTRFVFGEDGPSSMAVLVEDQTGQKSVVSFQLPAQAGGLEPQEAALAPSRRNIHNVCGATERDRTDCRRRLEIAADLNGRICESIRTVTGFHTTGGISVSPLLAKLASGLHKPKSVNVLFPWRSSQLIYSMPLRKMHKIGQATAKVLEKKIAFEDTTFRSSNGRSFDMTPKEQKMQTVLDLLELPRSAIREAIQGLSAFQSDTSRDDHCELLIQQCRGLDTSDIVDDNAGLPKSVSVENSFRRGTLLTEDAVKGALEDLYRRLPLLLKDRASWAKEPKNSYPNTIRLTVRLLLDPQMSSPTKRRSSRVTSRQSRFDGLRYLVQETDLRLQSESIKKHVLPMLREMLLPRIDVTRINISVTGFQDIAISKAQDLNGSLLVCLDPRRAEVGSEMPMTQSTLGSGIQFTQSRRRKPVATFATPPSSKRTEGTRARPTSSILSQSSSKRMKTTRIDHFFGKK